MQRGAWDEPTGVPPRPGERGLSLVELMVALGIIAVGLVGLGAAVPITGYAMQEGNQVSTATFLAEQRLEQVRNAVWTSVPANDCLGISASASAAPTSTSCSLGTGTYTTFADETGVSSFPSYRRSVRVTDCSVGAGCFGIVDSGLRGVSISVSYTTISATGVTAATTKSVTLETLVARR